MMLRRRKFFLRTFGPMKLYDITGLLQECAEGVGEGVAFVHVKGSTPALLLTSYGEREIWDSVSSLIPAVADYEHPNAYAHLRSSLISTAVAVPIRNGVPVLGERRLYLLEIEHRSRKREIEVAVLAEEQGVARKS